jgi:integrase
MPRPRPPYLHRHVTRHGKVVWYVQKPGSRHVRIRPEFGTPEFAAAYEAAIAGAHPTRPNAAPGNGTLAWLIARYRETSAWVALSAATRRQRENIFKQVIERSGAKPYSTVTQGSILAGRERRKDTPAQARNFLDAMRGLFAWAVKAQMVRINPVVGVENPPRKKGDGFRPWTEDDVTRYEARWLRGTRQRVWLDVLLYTGLRRGDAVRLGRQHVRDGIARLKTEKSDHTIQVTLPILPALATTLAAGPCGQLTFIAGANGKPFTKESFGNEFRVACAAAGVPGSAHGVRKLAATRAANNGATVAQLEALFGWTGGTMASLYTRSADRERLAIEAVAKLANDSGTSIFTPGHPVRTRAEKSK